MHINPKQVKKQFEKSYETYNDNALVQKVMASKLVDNIKEKEFQNILELGCGTGLLTQEIKDKIKFEKFFANDIVEKSKNYICKIIPTSTFYCGDAKKIKPQQKMDLIISNATFQWFENLEKITEHYKTILNPKGILAFSTFSEDNFKEIKDLCGLSLKYKSFNETKNILEKNFNILYSEEFIQILEFSNPLELLAHMKNTGVNSLNMKHWTFKEVKSFCESYKEKYPKITLTYTPAIFICEKK